MIYLLTGPVQTGKTTRLMQWLVNQPNAAGILAPVLDGKRYVQNIRSGETKLLEATGRTGEENVPVGRFVFSEVVFAWARNELLTAINIQLDWLVIDEIGKLELTGKGLEPAVSQALQTVPAATNIILVIRDTLLSQAIHHYRLTDYAFFTG